MAPGPRETLTFGDCSLEPSEGVFRRRDTVVELQPKVFEALVFFARNAGRLITKDELLDTLWPDTVVEEASLTQVVHKLRKALGEGEGEPRVLHTVLKRGFRLVAEVRRTAVDAPPEPAASELPAPLGSVDVAELPAPPEPAPPRVEPAPAPVPVVRVRRGLTVGITSVAVTVLALVALTRATPAPATKAGAVADALGDPHTRVTTRLTRLPERDQEPALAPDQSWFAFASTRGAGGRYAIWVQRLDGGDAVQVTHPAPGEDTSPRIAEDGRAIVFTRCDSTNPRAPGCAIWRAAPLGGDERLLVPDCTQGDLDRARGTIVCTRGGDGAVQIVDATVALAARPADATPSAPTVRTLLAWPGPIETVRVSPTGDRLTFLSRGEPWVLSIPPEGTAPPGAAVRLLEPGAFALSVNFTSDGEDLLLDLNDAGRRTIWAVALEPGGSRRPVTFGSGVDVYPELSRDGRRLLYTHESSESVLYAVDANGRMPQRLDTRTSFLGIATGRLGHRLAVWDSDSPSGDGCGVLGWPGPAAPQLAVRGLGAGVSPALSPDESAVAFVDRGRLIVVDLNTGGRRELVPSGVEEVRPAFSFDGRSVAYVRAAGETAPPGLAIARLDGEVEAFFTAGTFSAPSFSRDGRALVAAGTPLTAGPLAADGLYWLPLDGATPIRLSASRSYEAAPLWLDATPGHVWVLLGERTEPRLTAVPLPGTTGPTPHDIALEVPPDPSNWGVFAVESSPRGGLLYLLKKVYADVHMVSPAAKTSNEPAITSR